MPETKEINLLHRLCRRYGIQTAYYDMNNRPAYAATEPLLAVLQSLGAPVVKSEDAGQGLREYRQSFWQRPLQPVIVAWDGTPSRTTLRIPTETADSTLDCHMTLETGEVRRWQWAGKDHRNLNAADVEGRKYLCKALTLPHDLPMGCHHLEIALAGKTARSLLISAPTRAYSPPEETGRNWGVFLPLYALRTKTSLGSGNFTDLGELADWVYGLGGRVISTLPFLASGADTSPYLPLSRLFWNDFYIDPRRAPEAERCPDAKNLLLSPEFQTEAASLRNTGLVDYPREMALKRRIIEELGRTCFEKSPERLKELERFTAENPVLEDYARFRAAVKKYGANWRDWPQPFRSGSLREGDYDEDERRYHLYTQWLAHQQITELSQKSREKGIKLYLDLPLGAHPDGYDVWREREAFIGDVSCGAPPDTFFIKGQDWGCPPMHPQKIREQGYRYPIACLRHHLGQAGILRIDHVMGLHHIFCIPRGMAATDGVYLRYHAEEFYAILSLESHRHRAVIVGEDLGTVPDYVRPAMGRHRLRRMHVFQYAAGDILWGKQPEPSPGAVTSLNTHDMPPFTAWWQGKHIRLRRELGLLDETEEKKELEAFSNLKRALLAFLENQESPAPEDDIPKIMAGILSYLASSKAEVLLVNLEDLWQETRQQNVPGTMSEYPNWQQRARYFFEEFCQMAGVVATLKMIDTRRRNTSQQ